MLNSTLTLRAIIHVGVVYGGGEKAVLKKQRNTYLDLSAMDFQCYKTSFYLLLSVHYQTCLALVALPKQCQTLPQSYELPTLTLWHVSHGD